MVASTDIKFYVHTNTNAPQLDNVQGSMIAVLDAVLVNGFGSQAVSSITVTGTTATVTFGAAHKYLQYQVIRIAGAAQTEYNGQHRILTVPSATTLTFELAVAPSVSPATGTITCDLPPLGFDLAFSGTGKRAYRSTNVLLPSRPYLRVVDAVDPSYNATYAKYAKVGIVEDMTDIDTMLGVQAPYDSANPSKNWIGTGTGTSAINGWAKWYYAQYSGVEGFQINDPNANRDQQAPSAGARKWFIVGTSGGFVIANTSSHLNLMYLLNGFGKFKPYYAGDIFNDYLASHVWYQQASTLNSSRGNYQGLVQGRLQNMLYIHRKLDGSGIASTGTASAQRISDTGNLAVSPNISTMGELIYTDVDIWADGTFRGMLPHVKWLYQAMPLSSEQLFVDGDNVFIALDTEFDDRKKGQVLVQVAGGL